MKVEDVKIGTKITYSTIFANISSEVATLRTANAIFQITNIYPEEGWFGIELIGWDKQIIPDITRFFRSGQSKPRVNFPDCDLFDLIIEPKKQDHSGMIYNPYNDNWSYL